MSYFPVRSFARVTLTDDVQPQWQLNDAPEDFELYCSNKLTNKLELCLLKQWGEDGFAKIIQSHFSNEPTGWLAKAMGYVATLYARGDFIFFNGEEDNLKIFNMVWVLSDKPGFPGGNANAYPVVTFQFPPQNMLTNDHLCDRWIKAWCSVIKAAFNPTLKTINMHPSVDDEWTPYQQLFKVVFHRMKCPFISGNSLETNITEETNAENKNDALETDSGDDVQGDSMGSRTPPKEPQANPLTHRIVNADDFYPSHPDEPENNWCQQLIKRLGHLPLHLWPDAPAQGLVTLRAEFPWAQEALDRLQLIMAFWQKIGNGVIRLPPLLLVGAAGCGKTRLAKRLGECLELPTMTVSAIGGGSQQIKGTERAWSNGAPSPLVRFIADHKCPNPLVIVDEIDKQEENHYAGTMQNALLGLVEPENARTFRESFLEVPCDLSAINWIMTGNDTSTLCGPLMSRIEVIRVGHPRAEHLPGIAQGVRTDLARSAQCQLDQLPWTDQDERWVRQQMGAMFSVRDARKLIEKRLMLSVTQARPELQVVASATPRGEAVPPSAPETLTTQAHATVVSLHRNVHHESNA